MNNRTRTERESRRRMTNSPQCQKDALLLGAAVVADAVLDAISSRGTPGVINPDHEAALAAVLGAAPPGDARAALVRRLITQLRTGALISTSSVVAVPSSMGQPVATPIIHLTTVPVARPR